MCTSESFDCFFFSDVCLMITHTHSQLVRFYFPGWMDCKLTGVSLKKKSARFLRKKRIMNEIVIVAERLEKKLNLILCARACLLFIAIPDRTFDNCRAFKSVDPGILCSSKMPIKFISLYSCPFLKYI